MKRRLARRRECGVRTVHRAFPRYCGAMEWLILHGGALGDLVLTLQLVRRLPQVSQGAGVTLVTRTDPGVPVDSLRRVRRVASEGLGLHWLYAAEEGRPPERLKGLVAGRFVLSALGGTDSRPHERLAWLGARHVYSLDPRPAAGCAAHITTQWQRRLEEQGIVLAKCVYEQRSVGDGGAVRPTGQGQIEEGGGVHIHPGSGGRSKCWALAAFLDVGQRLREAGYPVQFVLGPAELEQWSRQTIASIQERFAVVCPVSTRTLAEELRGVAVFVGNDAGPSHLAAFVGVPTVTVFGPTDARIWHPLGPRAVAIQGDPQLEPERWGVEPGKVATAVEVQLRGRALPAGDQ